MFRESAENPGIFAPIQEIARTYNIAKQPFGLYLYRN